MLVKPSLFSSMVHSLCLLMYDMGDVTDSLSLEIDKVNCISFVIEQRLIVQWTGSQLDIVTGTGSEFTSLTPWQIISALLCI